MEKLPLPALFDQARRIHAMASNSSSVDPETLRKGVDALRLCDERVSKLGLFSANESKDDVSTANLKYLLEFISICEALELVPEEEIEASKQGGGDNFTAKREKKIARFRRQRAEESKLQEIKERKERRVRSLKAAALSTRIETGDDVELDDDGEEEREGRTRNWIVISSTSTQKELKLGSQTPFTKPVQPITCATYAQAVIEGRAKASQAHEINP